MIGSFVRSNDGGQMGFVGDPNRLNVAISRARCVFYCFSTSVGCGIPSLRYSVFREMLSYRWLQ